MGLDMPNKRVATTMGWGVDLLFLMVITFMPCYIIIYLLVMIFKNALRHYAWIVLMESAS